MSQQVVIALHGFLGEPKDWEAVFFEVKKHKPEWDLRAFDFMKDAELGPNQSLQSWGEKFCRRIEKIGPGKKILVGYSMGGRLALQAVQAQPSLWRGALFLSTHPGLSEDPEKKVRQQQDQIWARRFLTDEFAQVLSEWNSQPVFSGTTEVQRKFQNIQEEDKQLLAKCLEQWSLSQQQNFRDELKPWNLKQIWVAGERDLKFSELLKTIPENPLLQKHVVANSGHRLLADRPAEIAKFIMTL